MNRCAVGAVGLACLNHVWHVERFPPLSSRTHASAQHSHGGGPAASAAVSAARLGAGATLWTALGDDDAAAVVRDELAAEGVRLHATAAPGARSFVSAVLVAPDGERFIFPYRGAGLADAPGLLDWSDLPRLGALLSDARFPQLSRHALALAQRHGVPTVGDWSDQRHWEQTAAIDHLIVSEECARDAIGADDPVSALAALRSRAEQLVAITLGPRGIVWDSGDGVRRTRAPRVDVVDSTGAGDACHGAYAFGLASGRDVRASMRLASAVGALACTGVGRAALPDLATADRLAATLDDEELA